MKTNHTLTNTWVSKFLGLSYQNWRKDITERLQGYFSCLIYETFGLKNNLKGLRTFAKIFSFIHLLGNLLSNIIPGFQIQVSKPFVI